MKREQSYRERRARGAGPDPEEQLRRRRVDPGRVRGPLQLERPALADGKSAVGLVGEVVDGRLVGDRGRDALAVVVGRHVAAATATAYASLRPDAAYDASPRRPPTQVACRRLVVAVLPGPPPHPFLDLARLRAEVMFSHLSCRVCEGLSLRDVARLCCTCDLVSAVGRGFLSMRDSALLALTIRRVAHFRLPQLRTLSLLK